MWVLEVNLLCPKVFQALYINYIYETLCLLCEIDNANVVTSVTWAAFSGSAVNEDQP